MAVGIRRHKATVLVALPALAMAVALDACESPKCGDKHRWAVKTGTDGDASGIDLVHRLPNDIATLRALPAPANRPENARVAPTETSAFVLSDVQLVEDKLSDDLDYHLVVRDDHGDTMIVEIPDPVCTGTSPWRDRITAARTAVSGRIHPTTDPASASETVSLWGIGFFDAVHGQSGVAPNGIEIHPVLGLCFGAGCAPP